MHLKKWLTLLFLLFYIFSNAQLQIPNAGCYYTILMSQNLNHSIYSNQSNFRNSFGQYQRTPALQQTSNRFVNQMNNPYQYNERYYNYPNYPPQQFVSQHDNNYNNYNYGYNEGYSNWNHSGYDNKYNDGYSNWNNEGYSSWNKAFNHRPSQQYPNSFDSSYSSDVQKGFPQVGRFGGAKKKKKQKNNASFSSIAMSSTSSNGPKVKQPSIKQQSSNQFCFPTHTQTTNFVQCPFNSNHIMQPNRLLTHINKCKQKSANAKYFQVCPYDPCHYFNINEINAHILVCEKRGLFVTNDDWNIGAFNNSTISSIPNSVQSESIEESTKMPSSVLNNQQKRLYEQFLIDP